MIVVTTLMHRSYGCTKKFVILGYLDIMDITWTVGGMEHVFSNNVKYVALMVYAE